MTWPSNSKCIILTSLWAILSALPRYHRDTILSDSHHDLRILSARGSQYIGGNQHARISVAHGTDDITS